MSARQAVVLVGGRGTRLWPLTQSRPKGLLPLAGKPFIEYQLDQLTHLGVEEVFLAIGTHHEAAWRTFADEWRGQVRVRLTVEPQPLDTAGPVLEVLPELDDRFLVLNGDVVIDGDLRPLTQREGDSAIGLVEVRDPSAYGVVVLGPGDVVERFVEKPPPGTAPAHTVSAGIYVLRKDALERWDRGPLSFERTVFPALVESGRLEAAVLHGDWLDIGTPDLLVETTGRVVRGETSFSAANGADAQGADPWRWVAPDATVATDATVVRAVVLAGATIESGAVVDGAVIGWGAVVEWGATVSGAALIGERARIGSGCEITNGARVAPGARLPATSVTFTPPA